MFAENNAINDKNYDLIVENTRKTIKDVLDLRARNK